MGIGENTCRAIETDRNRELMPTIFIKSGSDGRHKSSIVLYVRNMLTFNYVTYCKFYESCVETRDTIHSGLQAHLKPANGII